MKKELELIPGDLLIVTSDLVDLFQFDFDKENPLKVQKCFMKTLYRNDAVLFLKTTKLDCVAFFFTNHLKFCKLLYKGEYYFYMEKYLEPVFKPAV